jgi:hypothetical protein
MDLAHAQPRTAVMRSVAIALVAVLLGACGAGTKSRRLLDGDGIGSVKFGQSPTVVAARLGRLFGRPFDPHQYGASGYRRFGCNGFYWEEWPGLGAASNGERFAAELELWFRNSRLVGYTYFVDDRATGPGTNWGAWTARRMMLATAKELAPGDPLARGQRLYGRAFVVTTQIQGTPANPRLPRLPVWKVSTASGRISGGIGSTVLLEGTSGALRQTPSRTIFGISAGTGPNTPC